VRAGFRGLVWKALAVMSGASVCGVPTASERLAGQESLPLTEVDVDLEVYGIDRAEDVRRGRVSIVYAPDGVRLTVYYLRTDPIQPRTVEAEPPPTPEPYPYADVVPAERALWVWTTESILREPDERIAFLDFVEAQRITRVFLYLAPAEGERPAHGYIPFSSEEMGPLLEELRGHGALVYALDGDRDYVLDENHAGVLRTVRRLVEHNRSAPPSQRFHGVRYDIEPYLAPGFQGPARQSLLDGYVSLLAGIGEIARDGGLALAVDVPFWFDAPDEETGRHLEATHRGRSRRLIEHIMEMVDDLAIMDYRTEAFGPDGALAHAHGELRLAEASGVDVFVGVETVPLVDEDLHTFSGPIREGLPADAVARWLVLEEDPAGTRIWLVDSAEALAELAARTRDATLLRHWPAGRPVRVAADKQSFRNHGLDKMEAVTSEIVRRLAGSPAFRGLAFHDYRGLRRLIEGR